MEVLEERDPFVLLVQGAAVERAREIQDIQDQNLAVRIVNALGEAMKKG